MNSRYCTAGPLGDSRKAAEPTNSDAVDCMPDIASLSPYARWVRGSCRRRVCLVLLRRLTTPLRDRRSSDFGTRSRRSSAAASRAFCRFLAKERIR
jgi:hypothetical protein